MFSISERFVASDLWMRLWVVGSLGLAFYCLFTSIEPTVAALRSPVFLLLSLFAGVATFVVTLAVSQILAFVVFQGMTERQAVRNGGPFAIGDRVVVIAGRHAGREGSITSFGQCQTLRVTLEGEEEPHGAYSDYQLKRAAEPCDASASSTEEF